MPYCNESFENLQSKRWEFFTYIVWNLQLKLHWIHFSSFFQNFTPKRRKYFPSCRARTFLAFIIWSTAYNRDLNDFSWAWNFCNTFKRYRRRGAGCCLLCWNMYDMLRFSLEGSLWSDIDVVLTCSRLVIKICKAEMTVQTCMRISLLWFCQIWRWRILGRWSGFLYSRGTLWQVFILQMRVQRWKCF